MKRFEVKIPGGWWAPCNIISDDGNDNILVEFKDLYGNKFVSCFGENDIRSIDVEITDGLIVEATVKALTHLNDNFIYLDKLDLEFLGKKIATVISEHFS